MKIVLIGPVYPYKGGISHYTGMMFSALREKHDVTMVSYSMQYPKFLYKKEQRNYEDDVFKAEDTRYLINTADPFNWVNTAFAIKKLEPDLVIIQWWHPYFAPCYWALTRLIKAHTRILFVCHNVFPHERFPADKLLTRMALKNADYYIVQSGTDEADLLTIKPDAVYRRTVHPTYSAFNVSDMSREAAREKLGIKADEKILLFFGFVRGYKGLKHLLNAMPEIAGRLCGKSEPKQTGQTLAAVSGGSPKCPLRLLIVGDFGIDKQSYLDKIDALGIADAVSIYDEYVPDNEVEVFFKAADVAVLPYESATQSGIVQISYGFGLPVIATNVGGLPDVVTDGVTGYLVEPFRPELIADAVRRFFDEGKREEFAANIEAESYKYSWERMVEVIESFEKEP